MEIFSHVFIESKTVLKINSNNKVQLTVEHMLSMHEALGLIPSTYLNKQSIKK